MKVIRGKVVKGVCERSKWMNKLESYYSSKTGIQLFPGSFHIQLLESCYKGSLQDKKMKDTDNTEGRFNICYVNGREVYYREPPASDFTFQDPCQSIIEIVTDLELIESLELSEGAEIEVIMPTNKQILLH